MKHFKNIEQVWEAVDQGKTVFWSNKAYKVFVEPNIGNEDQRNCEARRFSRRKDQVLSVRCIENYFGSVLSEGDLNSLFLEEV